MKINQKQKDFVTISGIIAAGIVFVIVGMFFFLADPKFLGYIFKGAMNSQGISLSRMLGVLGFFIALLIAVMGIQASHAIKDRKRSSGGRW